VGLFVFTGRKDTSKVAVEVRPGDFFSAVLFTAFPYAPAPPL
jgi:hypothetical protein